MSDDNGNGRQGGNGRGSHSRSYFTEGVFTYPLIFRYPNVRLRHDLGRTGDPIGNLSAVDAVRPIAPRGPSPYHLTEHEPAPCALGACDHCGRTLVSVFGHADRKVRGTCGACAKAGRC